VLYNIFTIFVILLNPVSVIKICLNKNCSKVCVSKNLSDVLPTQDSLRQVETVSSLHFNLPREKPTKIRRNWN
jgi:hypothetical protein